MKIGHIIGIIVIAIGIMVIISTIGDASSYVTFDEAKSMAESGNNTHIHVVGKLKKDENGEITGIEQSNDKLSFEFTLIDSDSTEQKVYHNEPMPIDFLRSEQVVVIGAHKENLFVADKILMKCPSKYQEMEI